MSDRDHGQRPRQPTCEDVDEDNEEFLDARNPANVAAKRTRPELNTKGSYERRRDNGGDSGYASRAPTVDSGSSGRKEKRKSDLKIDTSIQERESRPYLYSASKTEAGQSTNRPVVERSASNTTSSATFYRHRDGECWICDKYGKHIAPPKGEQIPPASPMSARHAPPVEDQTITQPVQDQPRMRRSSSQRTSRPARPASMYVGAVPEILYPTSTLPSPFATESPSYTWHAPTTPLYTPLTPVSYVQYQTSTVPQTLSPMESRTSYFVQSHPPPPPPPAQSRPVESARRASMLVQHDRPVVQQGKSQDREEALYDRRPPMRSQKSSRDKDYDSQAMPPPPLPKQSQVVYGRRPIVQKAATSASITKEHRRSVSLDDDHDEVRRLDAIRGRKSEASHPPTSYRGPSAAILDRPSARKMTSYDSKRHSINVASSAAAQTLPRRMTEPSIERHEAEAEAYQRKRGSSDTHETSSPLTAEALRKVPKARPLATRSETNSSQKSRNSSSKGSSGAKTGRSNPDIMMRINGIAIGVPSDHGQRITISSKGMNISVGGQGRSSEKEYTSGRIERAPSVTSKTSKTSRSSGKEREKENRWEGDRDGGRRSVREESLSDRAGRRSQSISRYDYRGERSEKEEPLVYGA